MQRVRLSFMNFVAVLSVAQVARTQADGNNSGNCVSEKCVHAANCTFNRGICPGWMNDEQDDTLDWKHFAACTKAQGISGCLTVNFQRDPETINKTARLYSPWICASGQNASLIFKYAIAGAKPDQKCPLSVYLTTSSSTLFNVWNSTGATWTSFQTATAEIPFPDCPFKIVFEAKKLKRQPCGGTNDEINLADAVFEGVAPPAPTSTSSTTATTQVTTTSVATTIVPNTNESTGASTVTGTGRPTVRLDVTSTERPDVTSALPSSVSPTKTGFVTGTNESLSEAKQDPVSLHVGAAAGIGVGAVVIIVLIIVVVVFLKRRKGGRDKTDTHLISEAKEREHKTGGGQSVMNHGHTTDEDIFNHPERTNTGNSHYETAGITDTSPVYSTPVDSISPGHQITAFTDKIVSDSGDIYSKPCTQKGTDDVTTKTQTDTSTPANVGMMSGQTEEHQYNKLFLENPRAARADHTPLGRHAYDHLEGVVHGLEKGVQPSDQSGKPNPGYVNVEAAKPADTSQPGQEVYNTLDKEHRANPPAVYANGGAVYNHLNEQVAIVNPPATGKASSATRLDTELYMNVGPDGVKTAPRPASGDVYNKLDFDVKNPGQANPDASDVYNHTV